MGCSDWLTLTADSIIGLANAMNEARDFRGAAYIEVLLQRSIMFPGLPADAIDRMYQTTPPKA